MGVYKMDLSSGNEGKITKTVSASDVVQRFGATFIVHNMGYINIGGNVGDVNDSSKPGFSPAWLRVEASNLALSK